MSQREMTNIQLLIVIVCYRAVDLTIDCLRSLAPQICDVAGAKVTVCENGSGGDAIEALRDAIEQNGWQDWVTIIDVHPNRGFAGGNNAVLSAALSNGIPPKFFLLLNSDTIMRPGAIKDLVDAADRCPDAGIIGPRLEWPDGTPQGSCFLDFAPIHEFISAASSGPITRLFRRGHGTLPISDSPCEAQWISFACALIRGEVMVSCGTLDDGYYLYFDDADYCRRARNQGWKVMYAPAARVVHLRGRSNPLKSLTAERQRRPRYWYVSRSRYYAKFYGRARLWLANVLWTSGRLISLSRELLGGRERRVCESEWRDIWINAWRPLRAPQPSDHQR